jgi:cytochrome c peroxidase
MKNFQFILFLLLFSVAFTACNKDLEFKNRYYDEADYEILNRHLKLPELPYNYNIDYPDYINSFVNTNIDYNKATLGRVLFYDKSLSSDKSVSCATCHKQELAFSDNVAFSPGAEGKVTTRNSIALGSVINFRLYYGNEVFNGIPFFWDNSANTIQEQSRRTLANPNEMNMHMSQVHSRVNSIEYYKPLIKKAYGKESLSQDQILDAIAEFTNSITNYNTKFDRSVDEHLKVARNTNVREIKMANFTAEENTGKNLYLDNCASCHGTMAGRPGRTEGNNGLYTTYSDRGMGANDGGAPRFKVPTLRNVLLTGPYMHDGSLKTIDDVLEHYSTRVKNTAGLSPELMVSNQAKKMNFSESDKAALKAFFATMTDDVVTADPKFGDPFIK